MSLGREAMSAEEPAAGSPDAHSMFLVHYLGLVKLSRLLVGDRETAEEIVQDVVRGDAGEVA